MTEERVEEFVPKLFQMQWHVTHRCNLRCGHCYQEDFVQTDLPFESLKNILDQYVDALNHFSEEAGRRIPGRITLTGGEPFLRNDFFELLETVHTYRKHFRYAVLTNGTMIDKEAARRLARLKPDYVQVSIDGPKEIHDALRAPGSFDRAVRGIRCLRHHGIRTILSFTASRKNMDRFAEVARLGAELDVQRVWADRLIPTTKEMLDESLSPTETKRFFEQMYSVRHELRRKTSILKNGFNLLFRRKPTEVAMHRALQFLVGGGAVYHCAAGRSLVAVLADGTLLPCRRLPIPVGNLLKTPLGELYRDADVMRQLRQPCRPETCRSCGFMESCGGGLRCLCHAVTGNPFGRDPGCWLPIADHFRSPLE